jgi:hypothetical protein
MAAFSLGWSARIVMRFGIRIPLTAGLLLAGLGLALFARAPVDGSFLVDVLGVEDVGAKLDGIATYHDSCHALRELTINVTDGYQFNLGAGLKSGDVRRSRPGTGSDDANPVSCRHSPLHQLHRSLALQVLSFPCTFSQS